MLLVNILVCIKPFHSPAGTGPQNLNNWLNPIFASSTFNNISTLTLDTPVVMWRPAYSEEYKFSKYKIEKLYTSNNQVTYSSKNDQQFIQEVMGNEKTIGQTTNLAENC